MPFRWPATRSAGGLAPDSLQRRTIRQARLWAELGGPLVTVIAVVVVELLAETVFKIPHPESILLLTTLFAAFNGGLRAGLISAGIAWLYLTWFLSLPGEPLRYTRDDLRGLLMWAVTIPVMVFMVAVMKLRADRASDEIVRRERDHSAALAASLLQRTRAEESLRALFDRNLAGIFRSRRDGRILECNTAFAHVLGFASRDEVLTHNAREFYLDLRDRERLMNLLQPGVVVSNHELEWRRADGARIWVLVNVHEVVEGGSTYLEGIVIDITDRKRAALGVRAGSVA